jgi:lipoate-protein ligase B
VSGAYLYERGVTSYGEAMKEMADLAAARNQGAIPDTVMLLEHEPVITLGSRAVRDEELPLRDEDYAARGIEVVEVGRGGRSTYHGPGQLVCYPVLDLNDHGTDLHRYVGGLERSIVATLEAYGIEGDTKEGDHASGVWVADRKIASIGVRCARWVTTHGLSVNVNLDLSVYELFDACGLGNVSFTSIAAETGRDVSVDDVRPVFREALSNALALELDPLPAAV